MSHGRNIYFICPLQSSLQKDNKQFNFKTQSPEYFGVTYNKKDEMWRAQRWSKNEKKQFCNGTTYKDEETAARASDTLGRKLVANGEKGHKLNFPDDHTEVYPEVTVKIQEQIYFKKCEFLFEQKNNFGVSYNELRERWCAHRWSKNEKKTVFNGTYKDEETAALASDTLAKKFIANGEKGHKLNFPNDHTEVHSEVTGNYIQQIGA